MKIGIHAAVSAERGKHTVVDEAKANTPFSHAYACWKTLATTGSAVRLEPTQSVRSITSACCSLKRLGYRLSKLELRLLGR